MRKTFLLSVVVVLALFIANIAASAITYPLPPVITNDKPNLQFVTVDIIEPVQGLSISVAPEPNRGVIAEIDFHVKAVGTANISSIHVKAVCLEGDAPDQEFDIYSPGDPIEPNYTAPSKTIEREFIGYFREGEWQAEVTAADVNGIMGSDTVSFSVVSTTAGNPGPASISSVTPLQAAMPILLRGYAGSPDALYTPGEEVIIYGENLKNNPCLNVYLSPIGRIPDPEYKPEGGLPVLRDKWVLYEAEILSKGIEAATGRDFMRVKIPNIPLTTPCTEGGLADDSFSLLWRWVIKDDWPRPERIGPGDDEYKVYPDPFKSQTERGPAFRLIEPAYPYLYGFGFNNPSHGTDFDEFLSCYGNNAYICIGALGVCIARVPDPIYWVLWYPVYWLWITGSGASCIGMSSTSLLMKNGYLKPEDLDIMTHYPAGFTEPGMPAQYDKSWLYPLGDYPRPKNLWAHIRTNHGVQTSAEYVEAIISQLDFGRNFLHGNPNAMYDGLGVYPTDKIVDMIPGFKGHGVTPFHAEGYRISIYDNNYKNSVQYIDIDNQNNWYTYNNLDWSGQGIYSIPLSVWLNERTMPGLDDADDYLIALVCGSADGLYTSSSGSWGWNKDGTFVDHMPDALALAPSGSSLSDKRTAALIFPRATSAPAVQVHNRGGNYLFHAAQKGRIFQLEVPDAPAEETDDIKLGYENGLPTSIQYTSAGSANKILPRIGLVPGERQRTVFRWGGLTADGGSLEFKALPGGKGVHFKNSSSKTTHHWLVMDTVDGSSSSASTYIFGPFDIPAGAVHRTTIRDWPICSRIVSEVDTNNDGVMDITEEYTGTRCDASLAEQTDKDQDGLPDQFVPGKSAELAAEFRIGSTSYKVNGEQRQMDAAPYIKEGRTFLPVRFVAYGCGVNASDVSWDPAKRIVLISKGEVVLRLSIGSKLMHSSMPIGTGSEIQMDAAPEITGQRTMLPVRWIAEQLGYEVTWDPNTQTVGLK